MAPPASLHAVTNSTRNEAPDWVFDFFVHRAPDRSSLAQSRLADARRRANTCPVPELRLGLTYDLFPNHLCKEYGLFLTPFPRRHVRDRTSVRCCEALRFLEGVKASLMVMIKHAQWKHLAGAKGLGPSIVPFDTKEATRISIYMPYGYRWYFVVGCQSNMVGYIEVLKSLQFDPNGSSRL